MVTKELVASAYHLRRYFTEYAYTQRLITIHDLYESNRKLTKPDYSPIDSRIEKVQETFIRYEREQGFPFDNNPLLVELGISDLVGLGALERLKVMIHEGSPEVDTLLREASKKVQSAAEIIRGLSASFATLPIHESAIGMYKTKGDDRVLIRFVLPAGSGAPGTLDNSARKLVELQSALQHLAKLDKNKRSYEFEVIALAQASPETVLLAVTAKVAMATNVILKSVLKRWKEVEEIRKIRAQTENLKADTEAKRLAKDQALESFKRLEDQEDMAKAVAKKLVKEHSGKLDGAPAEVEKAVSLSVKYVENLTAEGGTVNIYLLPEQVDDSVKGKVSPSQELLAGRKTQAELGAPKKVIEE